MVGSTHACAVLTIVYIIERTNSNYVPTDRIAMTHVQPGKIAKFIAIDGRNPVASPETGIKFVRHCFCGIIGIGFNMFFSLTALNNFSRNLSRTFVECRALIKFLALE